jgi:peptidoglycan/LPS O-acetylase OafA/YrhL
MAASRNYLRSLEGARGLAALAILTYHTAQLSAGHGYLEAATARFWLGVPLFFVLSGFLLYRPFAGAVVHARPRPSVSRYTRARLLRIVPAYWIVLTVAVFQFGMFAFYPVVILVAVLVLWLFVYFRRPRLVVVLAVAAITAGWAAYWTAVHPFAWSTWPALANYLLVYIPLAPWQGIVGPAWSLCIEISFYVFLPLVALVLAGYASRAGSAEARARRLMTLLVLVLPVGIVYLWLSQAGTQSVWLPDYLDEFAAGMILAVAVERWPHVSARASRLMLVGATLVGVAANLLYRLGPRDPYGNGSGIFFPRLMVLAFVLVLASFLMRDEQTVVGRVLSTRTLVAAGTVSYGIYLWHFVIIERLDTTDLWWSEGTNLLLVLAVTLAVAFASWRVVERPLLTFKDEGLRRRPRLGPVSRQSLRVPELDAGEVAFEPTPARS